MMGHNLSKSSSKVIVLSNLEVNKLFYHQISSDYFSPQGVVQECRVKKYSELWGCVPLNVDYPHTENICGTNIKKNGRPILVGRFSVTVPVKTVCCWPTVTTSHALSVLRDRQRGGGHNFDSFCGKCVCSK
ncbi:hypothetical protein CDAR_315791 [Caerostris darwini]|uniref:Uncharacterized protein n=1 Tax=Caerostris darwini TaxID=1538125 RepID=A0AAV4PR78_9ARAC|nr:hypothetical protein CDAR_315791 [Caerostris darwini]